MPAHVVADGRGQEGGRRGRGRAPLSREMPWAVQRGPKQFFMRSIHVDLMAAEMREDLLVRRGLLEAARSPRRAVAARALADLWARYKVRLPLVEAAWGIGQGGKKVMSNIECRISNVEVRN